MNGHADTMIHEPRRFLGYTQCPRHFVTANSVLAVDNKPHRNKPLVQTEW